MAKMDELKWDSSGLLPAVVQDAATGEVLMLAYMNADSMARTRDLGETVFFSRSRQALWHKGETSGNTQKVVSLAADCDKDAVLVQVNRKGPACHTGASSCFFESVEGFSKTADSGIGGILNELENLIAERKKLKPEGSYTVKLLNQGLKRVLQKVGEEAVETVIAGLEGGREETIVEVSDLLFHLLVALGAMDISLQDIADELRKRRH